MPIQSTKKRSHHSPLPLQDLKGWVIPDIYSWLEVADREATAFQEELDAQGAYNNINLFSPDNNLCDEDYNDNLLQLPDHDIAPEDDEESVNSDHSDADYEGYHGRIRVWSSSSINIDGFGTLYKGPVPALLNHHRSTNINDPDPNPQNGTTEEGEEQRQQPQNQDHHQSSTRIVYVISESWEGYGDLLWASSRHLAQLFADPIKCRDLLAPLLATRRDSAGIDTTGSTVDNPNDDDHDHPLQDVSVLELGAGCGVPSLMAMKCGAKVVCTDLDNPNRIRCVAESMERNWSEMVGSGIGGDTTTGNTAIHENQQHHPTTSIRRFHRGRACPFRWGKSSISVAKTLQDLQLESSMIPLTTTATSATTTTTATNSSGDDDNAVLPLFDVICATDCLFMPWLHYDLLTGMEELLAPDGVIIIAFAIHEGYSKDHEVWPFVDKARERGFDVEILTAVQLTPPKKGMPAKQGLVNMLRITKKQQSNIL